MITTSGYNNNIRLTEKFEMNIKYHTLFSEGQFYKDNKAQIWQKNKDNVRKFKDKPRLIFGSKSKNGIVDNNFFPFLSILYT